MSSVPEEPSERYQEIVSCQARAEEGLIFIKVGATPWLSAVEFDVAQARHFAEQILSAVAEVEAGWIGHVNPSGEEAERE
ncbi:hypothetical protein EA658_15265 [Pseudoxanthomonas winnipegensis]|jgi:hypothetical protein|uniref:Uncharacterized protein n=1 Tax=Pseudoxanthomonas winnipegensis TaxID=2480810 RepID=A0ABY1WBW5_9GAMM|nr:hypothetical protein [Pseudoxanthomonas winnipegensis]TAA11040.1 hypothetical protein EA659_06675 [Pseudoxanthomonas winnipegensis]TAA18466.1 hypothetical protein EA658_15265 [Pseudoxanthomonas winnipegensis]TAH74158.1 hypothetical protein EA657_01480 [Pseudoxanthomonas winnipegensis]